MMKIDSNLYVMLFGSLFMRIGLVLLFIFIGPVVARASNWQHLLGDQHQIIQKVKDMSTVEDYSGIYDLLSDEYKSVVEKDDFVSDSQRLGWKVSELQTGTLSRYSEFAYIPVRATVILPARRLKIDSVVFFLREEAGWKMLNFPFVKPGLAEFGMVPEFFSKNSGNQ